jgi:hypothetical protein
MPRHTVRPATEDDIPWMVDELRKFGVFYGTKKSLFPGAEVAAFKLKTIIDGHVAIVSVNSKSQKTGFICGVKTPHFMNEEIRTLVECLWWVPEQFRGSRAGYLLLKEFTDAGRLCADWVQMTTEMKFPVCERLLNRFGYRHFEQGYLLEV